MTDVITRFRLETTQYDSKLRDASKGLAEYTRRATQAGNEFGKFTQKNVEAARALGSITPSATNAKDKVKELVGAFNDAAKAYNALTKEQQQSDFGKAMAESISQLSDKIREAKQELYGLGDAAKDVKAGGGLFSGLGDKMSGALQVFAGNMLTKAAGAVASLGSEMVDMVKQGVEMAKAGEGIRIAFERLGRGDILDGLREATHGTVTDLELMKAAVKFNDFKLPVEELGTMLAFAQQKAEDTGQSVDYMVDSIVTGLGRKSLMILDNLGLSANEVKEKMAETGDMTKAVGEIIREQMAKAGDYVETAADRAAQANVSLQNKMEELGRKFAPLEEASNNFWTSMKIGILDLVGGPLTDLLNKLTEAGRLANAYGILGGSGKVGRMKQNLSNAKEENRQSIYQQQQAKIWDYINRRENYMKERQRWISGGAQNEELRQRLIDQVKSFGTSNINDIKAQTDAAKKVLAEYQQSAKQILQPIKQDVSSPTLTSPSGGGKGGKTEIEAAIGSIDEQTKKVQDLQKAWRAAADDDSRRKIKEELESAQVVLDNMTGKVFNTSNLKQIAPAPIAVPKMELTDPMGTVNTMKQTIQLELKTEAVKVDETTLQTMLKDAVQNGIKGMDFQFNALGEKIGAGLDVPDSAWEGILEQYNALREQIGLEPIKIDFKTGGLEEAGKDAKSATKDFQQAASAIGSVGSALSSIEDPSAKVAGIVAQAIATVASAFAGALGTDQTTKSNIWAFIAAAAASTATMVSTIASIHSATGYAQGGMIKGNSYSGDNILGMVDGGGIVGLNAGEIVLNQAQTANVANALEGSGMRGIDLSASVSGEQILLVANRTTRRQGRGELVTWK